MNKKLLMFGLPVLAIGLVAAIIILTTQAHINIIEGQVFEYRDWVTGAWTTLPLNTGIPYDFPDLDINAGDQETIEHRANNPNVRPIMYTMNTISPDPNVTVAFSCLPESTGVEYYVVGNETTNMTWFIRNSPGQTSYFGLTTIVDAGAPLTTNITIPTTYDRAEVDPNITWSVCP